MWRKLWNWIWGVEEKKENKVTIKDFAESDMLADFKVAPSIAPSIAPPEPVKETPEKINSHYRFEQKKPLPKKKEVVVSKKKVKSKKK